MLDFLGFLRYVLSFHIITLYHFIYPVVCFHLVVVTVSFSRASSFSLPHNSYLKQSIHHSFSSKQHILVRIIAKSDRASIAGRFFKGKPCVSIILAGNTAMPQSGQRAEALMREPIGNTCVSIEYLLYFVAFTTERFPVLVSFWMATYSLTIGGPPKRDSPKRKAVAATQVDPDRAGGLNNLGDSLSARFYRTGALRTY